MGMTERDSGSQVGRQHSFARKLITEAVIGVTGEAFRKTEAYIEQRVTGGEGGLTRRTHPYKAHLRDFTVAALRRVIIALEDREL